MRTLGCSCLLSIVVLASGCAPSVSRQQAEALQAVSGQLLQHAEGDIPKAEWPQAVAVLEPERVSRDNQGVRIRTWHFFVEEHGVFILDPASSFAPMESGDPSYEPVSGSVFVYRIAG